MASVRHLIFLSAAVCCCLGGTLNFDTASAVRKSLTQAQSRDDSLDFLDFKDNSRFLRLLHPLVKEVESWNVTVSKLNATSCLCYGDTCSCCFSLSIAMLRINQTGCLRMSFLPNNQSMDFALMLNGAVLYHKVFSLKSPPEICAPTPGLPLLRLCVNLYDVRVAASRLHLCLKVQAKTAGVPFFAYNVGCLDVPSLQKRTIVKEILVLTSETVLEN